jgi:uncharacterized alkaline shock family protein YloU
MRRAAVWTRPREELSQVSEPALPGRGLVTRRAVADVVRRAAVGCYGVASVSGPRPWDTLLAVIGRSAPGVRVRFGPPLRVQLHLTVAHGVPVAEVARNVDEAVRYAVTQSLDRDVEELDIHVARFRAVAAPHHRRHPAPTGDEDAAPTEVAAAAPAETSETSAP